MGGLTATVPPASSVWVWTSVSLLPLLLPQPGDRMCASPQPALPQALSPWLLAPLWAHDPTVIFTSADARVQRLRAWCPTGLCSSRVQEGLAQAPPPRPPPRAPPAPQSSVAQALPSMGHICHGDVLWGGLPSRCRHGYCRAWPSLGQQLLLPGQPLLSPQAHQGP